MNSDKSAPGLAPMHNLCQFNTPLWVAEALVARYFPKLDAADLVVEPSCGTGAFLRALPSYVPAIGVDIDPKVAAQAREESRRQVIEGDFRTVFMDCSPTAIIGNPPFVASVFDGFLDRAYEMLPEGAQAGFILPIYFFQSAGRVLKYNERWSISHELLPRTAFHSRMRTPLMFTVFSKDAKRLLFGLGLYQEADEFTRVKRIYRELMTATKGSMWKAVCQLALSRLGGQATLADIYKELEAHRPTPNAFWRDKIRQTLRVYRDVFKPLGPGHFALLPSHS